MTENFSRTAIPTNARLRNTVLFVLAIGLTLGVIWRFSSWHHRLGFETLVEWGKFLQHKPLTILWVTLIFMAGGLIFFIHAVLLWVTAFTFDTWHAILYAEIGSIASAILLYSLGRVLRRDVVNRIAGSYAGEVSRALAHRGIMSLFLLHFFPVCPFSVLNLLAGATHISWRDFLLGTLIGITPGIIVLCVFGNRFIYLIHHPNWQGALGLAAFLALGWFALTYLRRGFQKNLFQSK